MCKFFKIPVYDKMYKNVRTEMFFVAKNQETLVAEINNNNSSESDKEYNNNLFLLKDEVFLLDNISEVTKNDLPGCSNLTFIEHMIARIQQGRITFCPMGLKSA